MPASSHSANSIQKGLESNPQPSRCEGTLLALDIPHYQYILQNRNGLISKLTEKRLCLQTQQSADWWDGIMIADEHPHRVVFLFKSSCLIIFCRFNITASHWRRAVRCVFFLNSHILLSHQDVTTDNPKHFTRTALVIYMHSDVLCTGVAFVHMLHMCGVFWCTEWALICLFCAVNYWWSRSWA